jgi:hypothetical protein
MKKIEELKQRMELAKAKVLDFKTGKVLADLPSETSSLKTGHLSEAGTKPETVQPAHRDVAEARAILNKPMLKPGKPVDQKEEHFKAAMHHASFWAGHQGMHDSMGDPMQHDMGAAQDDSGLGDDFDQDDYLRSNQEETGHLPKADHHLKMFNQHLKAAGGYKARSEEGFSDRAPGKLFEAVASAKPGREISHIDGTHISHFGPGSAHDQSDGQGHIESYAHESSGDTHPMDAHLPKGKSKMSKSLHPGQSLNDLYKAAPKQLTVKERHEAKKLAKDDMAAPKAPMAKVPSIPKVAAAPAAPKMIKSEHEKGVHRPMMTAKPGESVAGRLNSEKTTKLTSKDVHAEKLAELKAMPTPKLPEVDGSKQNAKDMNALYQNLRINNLANQLNKLPETVQGKSLNDLKPKK